MNALTSFLVAVIRARKLIFALAIAWAVAGVWLAMQSPVDALPNLSENQVLVYAPWPDHNPPEVFEAITRPLSAALQGIPGVATLRGSSDVGFSLLYFIFDDSVDFAEARRRVGERLQAARIDLPSGVEPQLAPEGIPTGQIVWYTLTGQNTDLLELRSWQDRCIAPRLQAVRGVAEVASVGGFLPEVNIDLDAKELIAHQLSFRDVERQLSRVARPRVTRAEMATADLTAEIRELENCELVARAGETLRLGDVGRVTLQPAPRHGVFEKDGNEMVAGIVHLRAGANPLEVTQEVLAALQRIGDELPDGYRLAPCYDRTALIGGAVRTVTRTLLEALIVATVCIVLIMRHLRSSLVIAFTLPLAVLGAFLGMWLLEIAGRPIHVNIMSLAGIAISIGVLVDAAVVIVENVTYQLKREFGDRPVTGDTDLQVARAAAMVAGPAVLAVLIMLVSFLPMFALGGIDGQLIRPLAWTKTLTLLAVVILTLTLVPALCRQFIRGRIRSERESRLLQSICRVYEPVLAAACAQPLPLLVLLAVLLVLAATALGNPLAVRIAVVLGIAAVWVAARTWPTRMAVAIGLVVLALVARSSMRPIALALRLPLDEGMVMDMPISLPRMTTTQAVDDLKARNMLLCRFPEVYMVTGKAGRAETAFDPAPIDMIESMIELRSKARWPRRCLQRASAVRHARFLLGRMVDAKLVTPPEDADQLSNEIADAALLRFNAAQRELCWHMLQTFEKSLGDELVHTVADAFVRRLARSGGLHSQLDSVQIRSLAEQVGARDRVSLAQQCDANAVHITIRELRRLLPTASQEPELQEAEAQSEGAVLREAQKVAERRWKSFMRAQNQLLSQRAAATWTQCAVDELCNRQALANPAFQRVREQVLAARYGSTASPQSHDASQHAGLPAVSELPIIDPHPVFEALVAECVAKFQREAWLSSHDTASLTGPNGEFNAALQMPGWANVWTRPIQNRIDMLTTGVNSEVGVRVLGDNFQEVVRVSEEIAEALRQIRGAADVIADPIRDKDYVTFDLKPDHLDRVACEPEDIRSAVEAATTGRLLEHDSTASTASIPVRVRLVSSLQLDSSNSATRALANYLDVALPARADEANRPPIGLPQQGPTIALGELISPLHHDGPATIKSTNGQLSNYVRLNIRDRDAADWVAEARATLEGMVLPAGIKIEWTGQFEHAARTRRSMLWIVPLCLVSIALLMYLAFHDVADTLLNLLSVAGALSGAVLMQWLCGFPFSLAVGVGYIACLGMAAATGMVMIVYLRQAVEESGGLGQILSLEDLQRRVIEGAVHRLRPKLLTETAMILSLAPLLWSDGVGADIIRPMAAPVLGGILVADEVIDLLIPALFFGVRRRRWQRTPSAISERGT